MNNNQYKIEDRNEESEEIINDFDGGAMPKIFKRRSSVGPVEVNKLAQDIYFVADKVKSNFSDFMKPKYPYVDEILQEIFSGDPSLRLKPTSKGKAGTIYIVRERPKTAIYTTGPFEPFVLKTFAQPKEKSKKEEKTFTSTSFSINELFDTNNLLKSKQSKEEKPIGNSIISIYSEDVLRKIASTFMTLQTIRHSEKYDMAKYKFIDFQTCLSDILMTFISFQKTYGIDCELDYLKESIKKIPSLSVYDLDFDTFLTKFNNSTNTKLLKGGNKITNSFPYNEVLIQQVLAKVVQLHFGTTKKDSRLIDFKDYFMERNPFIPNKKTIWIVQNICGFKMPNGIYVASFNKLIRNLLQLVKDKQDGKEIDMDIDVKKIINLIMKLVNDFFGFLNILKAYVSFQHTDMKNENIFVLLEQDTKITSFDDFYNVKLVVADLDKSRIDYIYNKEETSLPTYITNNLDLIEEKDDEKDEEDGEESMNTQSTGEYYKKYIKYKQKYLNLKKQLNV
jgi:hypothetical protein